MESTLERHEREVRAARNQALFRRVNEKMRELNEPFADLTGSFAITCECADSTCTGQFDLPPTEYEAVREHPARFFVLRDHVYPEIESVVSQNHTYVVVQKFEEIADAADLAER
jgi:hypothetical protein